MRFEAVLLLSFGGPDGPEDVMPFLRNVLRGRTVPPERMEQVAEHYHRFGGRSPINDQNRALLSALRAEFERHGRPRPLYWGNRNWTPYLEDAVAGMRDDGIGSAAVFVTSAYSSYSSCRQYLEDLERARTRVGRGAPVLQKLRPYFNHPGFVEPLTSGLNQALDEAGRDSPVLMSAHSLPVAMARTCDYERQLQETARLVADGAGIPESQWTLVYQSRSGTPAQPWLGPDVNEVIDQIGDTGQIGRSGQISEPPGGPAGGRAVVVAPIGFVSDHMEVMYDLDTEAAATAARKGLRLVRSATPGTHPRFVHMVCELLGEVEEPDRAGMASCGRLGPAPSPCPPGCCPPAPAGPGAGHPRPA